MYDIMATVKNATVNKFCRSVDLTNEASIESFFVLRLLKDLGYADKEILTKKSIQELKVPKGVKKELYKPDYIISLHQNPYWLIDAKGTNERIEEFIYQCAGYSFLINRKFSNKPLRFFMLTNGLLTRIYKWDEEEPILSLRFGDFVDGNTRYETLKELLSAASVKRWSNVKKTKPTGHLLTRPKMDEIKRAFLRCHRIIWKSEKISPQAAFVEFAKMLFVKLWEDRRLRDNANLLALIGKGEPLPSDQVRFSAHWIVEQEANSPNPIDGILFRQLVEFLEQEIAQRKRKRIFEPNERMGLSPGTIKRVVELLEHYYLFGIDEDLNGRMFEAFLTATMRGKDLGQLFTPRSITKVMVHLADLKAEPKYIEKVLDGCCGTGGFLIEALTEMRRQLYQNLSLTTSERNKLLEEVANKAIFGIDAGKNPPIARIARINMYLHGDGGSRIYSTDALRTIPKPSGADSVEIAQEIGELRNLLNDGIEFDVVLTNPPFSMDYSLGIPDEKEVLQDYELIGYGGKKRNSLRSSVMFLERYWKLLRKGGRLLTVIDDSVLSGKTYAFVRAYIREKFIIRAIISLHGDAFQRAGARVKTSVLYLTKRMSDTEEQPGVFVYESRYIGLDDVVPRTRASVANLAQKKTAQEMNEIQSAFVEYIRGKKGPWLVAADRLKGRLDAKYLRPWKAIELSGKWEESGATALCLHELVDNIAAPVPLEPNKEYTFIKVTYSGQCERGEKGVCPCKLLK
jgi:type I restriction enzyme M protein